MQHKQHNWYHTMEIIKFRILRCVVHANVLRCCNFPWPYFSMAYYIEHCCAIHEKKLIRPSVDGLSGDGTGKISRDAWTKRVQTHGIWLANTWLMSLAIPMPTGLIYTFVNASENSSTGYFRFSVSSYSSSLLFLIKQPSALVERWITLIFT